MIEKHAQQSILGAAQRDIFHQGVPQQFEMVLNARTNPNADSAMAFFTGANNWEAMEDVMSEQGAAEMGYLGYDPDGGVAKHDPREPSQPKNLSNELKKAAPQSRQMAREAVDAGQQVVSGAIDTAKEVVSPAVDAAKKVLVRIPGSGWMPASEKVLEQLKAQFGDKLEINTSGQTK